MSFEAGVFSGLFHFRSTHLERRLGKPYKILYISQMSLPKPIEFRGNSLDDLRDFPEGARREAGYQLDQVQHGRNPDDWKPMPTIGKGVHEIRIRDMSGIFRVIYLARMKDAIYVLHCFQKKTQKTARSDIELANRRYRELLEETAL